MKKILVLAVLILAIDICGFSQKARFGINGGGTFSYMESTYQGRKEIIDGIKAGMTVGLMTEVPIAGSIYAAPSLNFTQKGGNHRYIYGSYTFEGSRTLNYAEILVNLLYRSQIGNGYFFGGLGPSVSYGLGGKNKDDVNFGGQVMTQTDKIEFGNSEDDDYKPIDLGANAVAGYEFASGVFFALNYNLGLNNLVNNGDENSTAKTRYFGFRIGYFLSHSSKK